MEDEINDKKGELLVMPPALPSLIQVADEEGYTKRELKKVKSNDFEDIIRNQYSNVYRIFRENFSYYQDTPSSIIELLAEFDNISMELTKFAGWFEANNKDTVDYAVLTLTPVKMQNGLIYHFKGTVEWSPESKFKTKIVPLSIVPVYGLPSGRIIELKHMLIGESWILKNAKVEYRSLDLRLGG
jgi:hypothetical protein